MYYVKAYIKEGQPSITFEVIGISIMQLYSIKPGNRKNTSNKGYTVTL